MNPRLAFYPAPRIVPAPIVEPGETSWDVWVRGEPDRLHQFDAPNRHEACMKLWLRNPRVPFWLIDAHPAVEPLLATNGAC